MSKKKSTPTKSTSVEFISLSSQIKTPTFEITENDNVLMFGTDNDIPRTLTQLYTTVPMHSAIIDKKTSLLFDGGIRDLDGNKLDNPNKHETYDSYVYKICSDYANYGQSFSRILWERGGAKVATQEHIINDSVRLSNPVKNDGVINKVYVNSRYNNPMYEWSVFTDLRQSFITPYLLYNTIEKKNEQVLHIKGYNGVTPYGLPDFFSAMKDLNTLGEMSTFHNANIHQNMQPGFKFIFEGAMPSKEEKDRIIKATREKYSSAENGGKPMFFFVPEGNKVTAEPMAVNDVAKMYSLLAKDVKESILVSHQIPQKIAGIETKGSLGSSKEVMELLELFKHTVIQPMQRIILDALEPIVGKELMFIKRPTDILLSNSVNDLKGILTVDELRELLGYEAAPTINESEVINE